MSNAIYAQNSLDLGSKHWPVGYHSILFTMKRTWGKSGSTIPSQEGEVPKDLANLNNNNNEKGMVLSTQKTMCTTRPKAIKLCCGHAGLTAALFEVGFKATGVDW